MHLTSYIKNPVSLDVSNGRERFMVEDLGALRGAYEGRGMIYTGMQRFEGDVRIYADFEMSQVGPARYVADESGGITVEREAQSGFPCSGMVTSTGEGYAIGPALQLDPAKGQSIALMFLSPRTADYNVSVEKNVLAASKEESQTIVTALGGEVRCLGTISSSSKSGSSHFEQKPWPPRSGQRIR